MSKGKTNEKEFRRMLNKPGVFGLTILMVSGLALVPTAASDNPVPVPVAIPVPALMSGDLPECAQSSSQSTEEVSCLGATAGKRVNHAKVWNCENFGNGCDQYQSKKVGYMYSKDGLHCPDGYQFESPKFPGLWNDKIESAGVLDNCYKISFWEHQGYQGKRYDCITECADMGSFAAIASSAIVHPW